MSYATKADLRDIWGIANVQKWSQLEPDAEGDDDARITKAITLAEAQINDRFRPWGYAIPLMNDEAVNPGGTNPLPQLVDMTARLAGVWLYESRAMENDTDANKNVQAVRAQVFAQIDRYIEGLDLLSVAKAEGDTADADTYGPFVVPEVYPNPVSSLTGGVWARW